RTLVPPGGSSHALRWAIATAAAAPAASLAYAASSPVRAWLFGAAETDGLPAAVRMTRDALISLAVALPLTGLVAAVVLRERGPAGLRRVSRSRSMLLAGGAAVLAASALGGSVRAADPGPGTPCPAGAPVKSFDVQ